VAEAEHLGKLLLLLLLAIAQPQLLAIASNPKLP
jgi:hypothetical protein